MTPTSAMPSYLLVDGHNVMHAWPDLAKHLRVANKRHLARTELLQRLRHLQDMTGTQVVVVFDGTTAKITEEREPHGLQIIYADAGHTADDLIEQLAAKYAKDRPMRVASADGLVRETVTAFGADWLSPEMLRLLCDDAERDMRGRMEKLHTRRQMLGWFGLGGLGFGKPATIHEKSRLREAAIAAAVKYATERKTQALLIKQHGRLLHESYPNGGGRDLPLRIYSGTKGFWGLAAMVAVEDGLIALDEPVANTLPEWKDDAQRGKITLEHLLNFTGGLEPGAAIHEDGLKDRNQMAMKRPMLAMPGKRFIYGPSQLQIFHEVLKRRLARTWRAESPTKYLERRVLRRLGLGPQRYLPDAAGNPLLAAGFVMTARQWSRLGDCLLGNGGSLLKPASFQALLKGSKANPAYSFGFWNNRTTGQDSAREIDIENQLDVEWDRQSWTRVCLGKHIPADLIACIGSGYQRLYVIPSLQLAIIRQGTNARFRDGDFLRTLLGSL
jgi:predicted RNA-binding protein with PIN domain/CubicO group peptidase (beta-lactamase class C family)